MNLSTMKWLNEPAEWSVGDSLTARAEASTDFWRKTHDSEIRHNGHFYFDSVSNDFKASVKVAGQYNSRYDQAGIMVLFEEQTWLKCGVELLGGRQHASAVVTRDCSDWSISPLANPPAIWIQCERQATTFTVRYSVDGRNFETIRQSFLAEASEQQVGLMLAAPTGNGFDVRFEDFVLQDA